jgi:hypothetical protein
MLSDRLLEPQNSGAILHLDDLALEASCFGSGSSRGQFVRLVSDLHLRFLEYFSEERAETLGISGRSTIECKKEPR